jgi:hypothetical protein
MKSLLLKPGDEVELLDDKIRGKVIDIGDEQDAYVEIEKDWIILVPVKNLVRVPSTDERLNYLINMYKEKTPTLDVIKIKEPKEIVDLHIEKICMGYKKLNENERFTYQVEYFKASLSKALALGFHRIIFIHGVGRQILRKYIEHHLLKNNIRNFNPADKKKYGDGAVEVGLR